MKRNKFLLNTEIRAGLNFIAFNLKLQIIGDIIVYNLFYCLCEKILVVISICELSI